MGLWADVVRGRGNHGPGGQAWVLGGSGPWLMWASSGGPRHGLGDILGYEGDWRVPGRSADGP